MPLGGFFLRRTPSSKSVASVDKSSSPTAADNTSNNTNNNNNSNNTAGNKSGSGSNSNGIRRGRKEKRQSTSNRSKSRQRSSSKDSRSSARSNASGHTLRSKSPSRARIQEFMDEIRAHEAAVQKRRSSVATSNSKGSPQQMNNNNNNNRQRSSSAGQISTNISSNNKTSASLKKKTSSSSSSNNNNNNNQTKTTDTTNSSNDQNRRRSLFETVYQPEPQSKTQRRMSNEGFRNVFKEQSTRKVSKTNNDSSSSNRLAVSERGRRSIDVEEEMTDRDRHRSLSRERLGLYLADQSGNGNVPDIISEDDRSVERRITINTSSPSTKEKFGNNNMYDDYEGNAEQSSSEEEEETYITPAAVSKVEKLSQKVAAREGKMPFDKSKRSVSLGMPTKNYSSNNNSTCPGEWNSVIKKREWVTEKSYLSSPTRFGKGNEKVPEKETSHLRSTSLGTPLSNGQETRTRSASPKVPATVVATTAAGLGTTDNSVTLQLPNEWHATILKRDWAGVEKLLQSYDRKRYSSDKDSQSKKTQKKQLRVLKYLPQGSKDNNDSNMEDDISPLLCVDSDGCTPLHLACKEYMPAKLLQKLLLLERNAASIKDNNGRYPLHISTIGNLPKPVLDKLIRADPSALARPDNMKRTPLAYAVLRAEHARDKNVDFTWRSSPVSKAHSEWQTNQVKNWESVQFILETMVTRRQTTSPKYESTLLLQSVESYIPPPVLNILFTVSTKITQNNTNITPELVPALIQRQYPLSVLQRVLKICKSSSVPEADIIGIFRKGMFEHYKEGCVASSRDGISGRDKSFRSELLSVYQSRSIDAELTKPCKEWWDNLRFLIAVASGNLQDPTNLVDGYVLHAALTIPESPAQLIELLIRMFPQSRYDKDPMTDALPLHLACRYWGGNGLLVRKNEKKQDEACKVLNLLMAGDFSLTWKRYRRRLPLHYAIKSGKPIKFIKILMSMDTKTANAKDVRSDLFPFQLAALPRDSEGVPARDAELNQIETIYELLRAYPLAVCPNLALGSGDPKGDVGPVARHVVNWCYSYKRGESDTGWFLDKKHVQVLRSAISRGKMPSSLKRWWGDLKRKIWNVYDRQNAGKTIAYMPRLDKYLLHAALYNGRTPPIVIELLLELYPDAVESTAPGTDRFPLHIAAGSPSYTPLPFETAISMSSALEMILLSYPEALREKSEGRTVLQIAVDSGKTYDEIRPLFQENPGMLTVPDRVTGLYPFQQIACKESSIPTHHLIRDKTSTVKWNERSPEENARFLRGFQIDYERDKLTSIYEMLRAQPEAIEVCIGTTTRDR